MLTLKRKGGVQRVVQRVVGAGCFFAVGCGGQDATKRDDAVSEDDEGSDPEGGLR